MNYRLILTFLMLTLSLSMAMAAIDPKLMEYASKACDFENYNKNVDQRLWCMEDYINCTTVGAGETDWSKLSDKCLKEAKKRAEEPEWTPNSKRK